MARFLDAIGTRNLQTERQRMVLTMKQADNTLLAGYSPKHVTNEYKRLVLLYERANTIFLRGLEFSANRNEPLPPELGQSVRALANTIGSGRKNEAVIFQPKDADEVIADLFTTIYDADAVINEPIGRIRQEVQILKPSLRSVLIGAFDKHSLTFLSSIRYGIVLTFAAIVAYSFDFSRSYWVPLSCAAVMSGMTTVATFHRTVQRTFGTIIGLLIASLILASVHNGLMIVLFILVLTFITELFIVRNYGVAAIFFTSSALIMAEYATQIHDFSFFATARLADILAGSLIGLAGTLIGRRSVSNLLDHLIAKTLRSQGQFFLVLFSGNQNSGRLRESKEGRKMHTNITNLMTGYDTACGGAFLLTKQIWNPCGQSYSPLSSLDTTFMPA
ncbi:FUSC family protein [Virgibacillus halophilus]|uniref:FUSC family protein n=1 Tax=Tigheibacillus halophilus TaxID=361280 RepID=A0ABU5C6U9_9BACI|nr:FUSC family protein [Virgibacillus halophilus]